MQYRSTARLGVVALLLFALLAPTLAQPRGQRFNSFRTKHYEVMTDLNPASVRWIAQHMDAAHDAYVQRLPAFRVRDSKPVRMYLFSNQMTYVQELGAMGLDARNTGGVFFATEGEAGLATWVHGYDRIEMLHVLQHEGFHQFAHLRIGANLPIWANEGLAEYFGLGILIGRRFEQGLAPASRLSRVQQAIRAGLHFPFEEMLGMEHAQWNARVSRGDRRAGVMYDQAWAMVHFLFHADNGRFARPFEEYLRLIVSGYDRQRAFARAFQTDDAGAFEQAWRRFMLDLEPDPVSTATERVEFLSEGLRRLHTTRRPAPESIEQLRDELRRVRFTLERFDHGVPRTLDSADDTLFEPPEVPPPDPRARRRPPPPTIELTPPASDDIPPGVIVKGLRIEIELKWSLEGGVLPVAEIHHR
ncbi:MAG: DUF1570 domain-containing protein [Phycisphaerales bacterium]|nr:MAG: DUF1570 domain-containing protein [Phycisphaerales bacterium]